MRIALPDQVSDFYFPTVAPVGLMFSKDQGTDVDSEVVCPVGWPMQALREGGIDFVAGPADAVL